MGLALPSGLWSLTIFKKNQKFRKPKGRVKKKTEKSDIVKKGRAGWTPKPYF